MHIRATPLLGFSLIYLMATLLLPIQAHLSWAYAFASLMTAALYGWTLGILYVAGALATFVVSDQYPVLLRVVHELELAVESLLGARSKSAP